MTLSSLQHGLSLSSPALNLFPPIHSIPRTVGLKMKEFDDVILPDSPALSNSRVGVFESFPQTHIGERERGREMGDKESSILARERGPDKGGKRPVTRSCSPLAVRGAVEDRGAVLPVYGVRMGVLDETPASSSPVTFSSIALLASPPTSRFYSFSSAPVLLPSGILSIRTPYSSSSSSAASSSTSHSSSVINYSSPLPSVMDSSAQAKTPPLHPHLQSHSHSHSLQSQPSLLTASNSSLQDSSSSTSTNSNSNNVSSSSIQRNEDTANPSGGFLLSKYVRDIGIRARSLVGGLLKRDEAVLSSEDLSAVEGSEVSSGKIGWDTVE